MSWLYGVAGVVLILVVFLDALTTALIVSEGAGPITKRLVRSLWRLALAVRPPAAGSRFLAVAGSSTLLATLLMWVALLWAGWTLVFLSDAGSIIDSSTKAPTGLGDTVYFVGFSVFTLGTGDFVGSSERWRLLSAGASFTGLFVVTLAITYVLSVISAIVKRRSVASHIHSLGTTGGDIVTTAWNGDRFGAAFDQHLVALTSEIGDVTEQHMAYPVLHVMHSPEAEVALSLGLAELNDAINLISCGLDLRAQPDRAAWSPVEATIDRYIDVVSATSHPDRSAQPPPLELAALVAARLPTVDGDEFQARIAGREESRRALARIAHSAGWDWTGAEKRPSTKEFP